MMALFSMLASIVAIALALFAYNSTQNFTSNDPGNPAVVVTDQQGLDVSALMSELKAQENNTVILNEELKTLAAEMAALKQKIAADKNPDMGAEFKFLSDQFNIIQQKIKDIDSRAAIVEQSTQKDFGHKVIVFIAINRLENITRKIQIGKDVTADIDQLNKETNSDPNGVSAAHIIDPIILANIASDNDLLNGFKELREDFLIREKLDEAEGFFEKMIIQMQKLITVRAKNAKNADESPMVKNLNEIERLIFIADWPQAIQKAQLLSNGKQPKEFNAWLEKLKKRGSAEQALNDLREKLYAQFKISVGFPPSAEVPSGTTP
jgi:hypothetical protein